MRTVPEAPTVAVVAEDAADMAHKRTSPKVARTLTPPTAAALVAPTLTAPAVVEASVAVVPTGRPPASPVRPT